LFHDDVDGIRKGDDDDDDDGDWKAPTMADPESSDDVNTKSKERFILWLAMMKDTSKQKPGDRWIKGFLDGSTWWLL
jgi:hypothetical protein